MCRGAVWLLASFALLAAVRPAAAAPWGGGTARALAIAAASRADAKAHPAAPPRRLLGARFIDGRKGPKNYVAFTFDDGPNHGTTPTILKLLAAYGIRATFFVCGYKFDGDSTDRKQNLAVLEAELAAGHMIGNHTYHHKNLATVKDGPGIGEIRKDDQAITRYAGVTTRLFRPPYGALTPATDAYLRDLGFTIVKWDVDPKDFTSNDAKQVAASVLAQIWAQEGGVVILHDVKPSTVEAFPKILAGLDALNCRRIAQGKEPIVPVELDYFAFGEDGKPLPVPTDVAARGDATRKRIVDRCSALSAAKHPKGKK